MRLVRLLRAMKGAERELTPGELALLNDHAKADWRPVIAATTLPVLFVAGAESEFWPSSPRGRRRRARPARASPP